MSYLQWILLVTGALLQILVLSALLRGLYKTYPFIFAYMLSLMLTTAIDFANIIDVGGFTGSTEIYYWINYALRQFLLLAVVLSLIDLAMARSQKRETVRRGLVAAALLLAGASFAIHRNPDHFTLWMTQVGRDVSFCAVILNLLLWSALVASREKDRTVLLIAGALGLQFTGEAIGHSLRQMFHISKMLIGVGNFFLIVPHFACLLLWWQTFRHSEERSQRLVTSTNGS